jgi:hypothetical protein
MHFACHRQQASSNEDQMTFLRLIGIRKLDDILQWQHEHVSQINASTSSGRREAL